jgi:hypothetical protein
MDMLGSRSGRTNVSKTTTLVTSIVTLMGRIQSADMAKNVANHVYNNSNMPVAVSRTISMSSEDNNKTTNLTTSESTNSLHNVAAAGGSGSVAHVPNSRIQLTFDEKDELVSVAKTALVKLRGLHQMLMIQSAEGGEIVDVCRFLFSFITYISRDQISGSIYLTQCFDFVSFFFRLCQESFRFIRRHQHHLRHHCQTRCCSLRASWSEQPPHGQHGQQRRSALGGLLHTGRHRAQVGVKIFCE